MYDNATVNQSKAILSLIAAENYLQNNQFDRVLAWREIINCKPVLLFILAIFVSSIGHSYFGNPPEATATEMNDIKFSEYKDFTKSWHLVTVRYRTDSKELRFTYANDMAWKQMNSSQPTYTDGAIFAKVGMITEKDPAFSSSEVPSGAKRFQFMVRDRKKYKTTNGWGYALFDDKGKVFNEDIKQKTLACAACHNMVPERDFVFSRPMNLDLGANYLDIKHQPVAGALTFESKPKVTFAASFQKNLNKESVSVSSLEGNLKKNYFSGTLDEVIPLLLENAKQQRQTSTLYINEQNYSIVKPEAEGTGCLENQVSYKVIIYFKGSKVREASLCN